MHTNVINDYWDTWYLLYQIFDNLYTRTVCLFPGLLLYENNIYILLSDKKEIWNNDRVIFVVTLKVFFDLSSSCNARKLYLCCENK